MVEIRNFIVVIAEPPELFDSSPAFRRLMYVIYSYSVTTRHQPFGLEVSSVASTCSIFAIILLIRVTVTIELFLNLY